jgi:hypothetical protein
MGCQRLHTLVAEGRSAEIYVRLCTVLDESKCSTPFAEHPDAEGSHAFLLIMLIE